MPINSIKQGFQEYGNGDLHSGKGGPVVKKHSQAVAIILSMAKKKGLPGAPKAPAMPKV
jgi:hypothetical protein